MNIPKYIENQQALQFMEACQDGDREIVSQIFANLGYQENSYWPTDDKRLKCILKVSTASLRTSLHQATYYGQFDVVKLLVKVFRKSKLAIDCKDIHSSQYFSYLDDFKGYTPLMLTCIRGFDKKPDETTNRAKIVKLLLINGATLNKYGKVGVKMQNPLHWACYFGDYELVKILLKYNDSLSMQKNKEEQYPIDYCLFPRKYQRNIRNDEIIAMLLVEIYIRSVMVMKKPIDYPFKLGIFLAKQQRKSKKSNDGLEFLREPEEESSESEESSEESFIIDQKEVEDMENRKKQLEAIARKKEKIKREKMKIQKSSKIKRVRKVKSKPILKQTGTKKSKSQKRQYSTKKLGFYDIAKELNKGNETGKEDLPRAKVMKWSQQTCHVVALMKKVVGFKTSVQFQKLYYVPSTEAELNDTLKYRHSLLYYSVVFSKSFSLLFMFKDRIDFVEMFLRYNTSPFIYSYKGQNACHAACEFNTLPILGLFLKSIYAFAFHIEYNHRKKSIFNFQKARKMNLEDIETFLKVPTLREVNTPLHLACQNGHLDVVKYLLKNKVNIDSYNVRGWTPFQLSRSLQIQKLEHPIRQELNEEGNPFSEEPEVFFEEAEEFQSDYQYAIITGQEENINDNVIYRQLRNIQKSYYSLEKGMFYIKALNSYQNRKIGNKISKNNVTIFLICCDQDLQNHIAGKLQIEVCNHQKGFLEAFISDFDQQFEQFKQINLQNIILFLLREEFDLENYKAQNIIKDHFPLHNFKQRLQLQIEWNKNTLTMFKGNLKEKTPIYALRPLNAICGYYGPKFGWYMLFLTTLTTDLIKPTIPGIILYLLGNSSWGSILKPIFSIYITIWTTLFLERWGQKQNEMKVVWDLHNYEKRELVRHQYHVFLFSILQPFIKGEFIVDTNIERIVKYDYFTTSQRKQISESFLLSGGMAMIIALFYAYNSSMQYLKENEDFPQRDLVMQVVGIVNGVLITVINIIYQKISQKLVIWENHKFSSSYDDSWILKNFVFQFVNSYITLVYLVIKQDENREFKNLVLYNTFTSLLISKAIITNIQSNVVPKMLYQYAHEVHKKMFMKFRDEKIFGKSEEQIDYILQRKVENQIEKTLKIGETLYLLEQLERSRIMIRKSDLIIEYTNIAILFGYIGMFSSINPLAPAIVFLGFWFKLNSDVWGLTTIYKRVTAEAAAGIGIWNQILQAIGFASALVNVGLLWDVQRRNFEKLTMGSTECTNDLDPNRNCYSDSELLIILIFIEHIILMLKAIIGWIYVDIPFWVEEYLNREQILRDEDREFLTREKEELKEDKIHYSQLKIRLDNRDELEKIVQKQIYLRQIKQEEQRRNRANILRIQKEEEDKKGNNEQKITSLFNQEKNREFNDVEFD